MNPAPKTFAFYLPHRRTAWLALVVTLGVAAVIALPILSRLWQRTSSLPEFTGPSRLYGRGFEFVPGQDTATVRRALDAAGYREVASDGPNLGRGFFTQTATGFDIALRRFPVDTPTPGGGRLEILLERDRARRLRLAGHAVERAELDPPLLASYYGPRVEERWPVRLDELSPAFVNAVLAAEDGDFLHHGGISLSGTLRALWVDLRSLRPRQGGSTITQQLAKILYLNSRRTFGRKVEEAILAVGLELRYSKQTILEAYLNQAYWGRSGGLTLRGVGAAARAYFGKDAQTLTVSESALLAGMIRAPAEYSPIDHPAAALARRNVVLARLASHRWISPEAARCAIASPLGVVAPVEPSSRVPYFAAAAAAEARERFGIRSLDGSGYLLFSTLDLDAQEDAEKAISTGLAALERKRHGSRPLQAALVSIDPRDGAILAYVGGRDPSQSVYDRAGQARRQLGSAFKPVIYAAAFAAGVASPSSLLDDSPVAVTTSSGLWEPQNFDRVFRGPVTARVALEQSLNVPTVRLAFQTGLGHVVDLAQDLGLDRPPQVVPALALGAIEASPREVAGLYATLAAGGMRSTVHALRGVVTPQGEWRPPTVDEPHRVLPAQVAFEVTSILEGVLDHGTGHGAGGTGIAGALAGKTGTTSDGRDSWFAGYSPDRATVVWVGHDDDSPSALTGASGAAPVWSRFIQAVRPPGGFPAFSTPAGMRWVNLDPASGELATASCPTHVAELLPEWQAPVVPCHLHAVSPGVLPGSGVVPAGSPSAISIVIHPSAPTDGGPSLNPSP